MKLGCLHNPNPKSEDGYCCAVQELDWVQTQHYATVQAPFDFVLAADCVYHEDIIPHFLLTVIAMTHSKSTGKVLVLLYPGHQTFPISFNNNSLCTAVVVVNELRSESVHNCFMATFEQYFTIKRTPRNKMDAVHQHSAIDILTLKRRKEHATTSWQDAQQSWQTAAGAANTPAPSG